MKLSSGDPETAGGRLALWALSLLRDAKPTTGSNQTTDLTNDGCAMEGPGTDGTGGDSRDRSSTHDLQRAGTSHHSEDLHGQDWVFGGAAGVR